MRKISSELLFSMALTLIIVLMNTGCSKKEPGFKYTVGTFPDSIYNLQDINTIYDDYNMALPLIEGQLPVIFSSNRNSQGGQFDLVVGEVTFNFDKNTGDFQVQSNMSIDPFLSALVSKANTSGNDFGPNRLFNSSDGYEYLVVSSQNTTGVLDMFYMKYLPQLGINVPLFPVPIPLKLLNSSGNDAYFSFDSANRTVYFTSDRDGDYDIYSHVKPVSINLGAWFDSDYASSLQVDSLNTSYEEKCPFIHDEIMFLTSNRPGGLGGYDLYYSVFKNDKWGTPVNMGPEINSSADEFRPVIGSQSGYTNVFIIFSSNRPGGKGGFDLYFRGFDLPENY